MEASGLQPYQSAKLMELSDRPIGFYKPVKGDMPDITVFYSKGYFTIGSETFNTRTTDRHTATDRESIKQEVYALLNHADTENWDGEGARPLNRATVAIAQKFVDKLPRYIIRPEIAVTPHGEVDFDWAIAQNLMLTISICPSGEIAFAGLFHDARLNGRERWTGILPQFVNCCFERLHESQGR